MSSNYAIVMVTIALLVLFYICHLLFKKLLKRAGINQPSIIEIKFIFNDDHLTIITPGGNSTDNLTQFYPAQQAISRHVYMHYDISLRSYHNHDELILNCVQKINCTYVYKTNNYYNLRLVVEFI